MSLVTGHQQIFIHQRHEIGEWLGFETRNKYEILDAQRRPIGFAAEQQKGILGFFLRQWLGHWRVFTLMIFDSQRQPYLRAEHPWRFWFQRLEVHDATGKFLGAIQQRFSIFTKKFDVEDASGQTILEVASPIWRIWTFPFVRHGETQATVSKKWSGVLSEMFTDKDNFLVEFTPRLKETERQLVLAAGLFIDLQYFEEKASRSGR